MRTAILALFVSLGMLSALALGSFFGFDVPLFGATKTATAPAPGAAKAPARMMEGPQIPAGEFRGPTGQPSVRGPSGPPPQR